jgi:hypothetical protein
MAETVVNKRRLARDGDPIMKISASSIHLDARRDYLQRQEQRQSLQVWSDADSRRDAASSVASSGVPASAREVLLSPQSRALQPQSVMLDSLAAETPEDEAMADLDVSLIKQLLERMTGRAFKLFKPQQFAEDLGRIEQNSTRPATASAAAEAGEGWGLRYDYYQSYHEEERTRFSANGTIATADGKNITFSVELGMSRRFMSEQSLSLRAGDALKDPLVVNFNGQAAQLTDSRFQFDIDADGRADQIAFVAPGSGFLALDRNQDGQINDGSELFGARSGDGFAELAAHDGDGNGWIDEADAIYQQLRIWSKASDGSDRLVGLGQAGVGALYLGHIATPFDLTKADDNELLGKVRDSGLYVNEDGSVGTLQQVDLKV